MPTYANSTDVDITHQGVRVPAQGTARDYRFLTNLPSGVTQVSVVPNYNPLISSTMYAGTSGSVTITMPASEDNYLVHFYCYGGSVTLAFNDASITPALTLVSGQRATMNVTNHNI